MMENGTTQISVLDLIEKAGDDAKKSYMTRIWAMTKDQLFHEVMRVQGESAKLLLQAQSEIDRLNHLVNQDDGDIRH
jgi:hypothetical protein